MSHLELTWIFNKVFDDFSITVPRAKTKSYQLKLSIKRDRLTLEINFCFLKLESMAINAANSQLKTLKRKLKLYSISYRTSKSSYLTTVSEVLELFS